MTRILTPALVLALAPAAALAHTGDHDAGGFLAGLAHPFAGSDHMLAMLAVGLWAAQAGGRAGWAAPATFLLAMLAGGIAGAGGVAIPAVEPLILASVVILGAAVGLAMRPPLWAALAALAVFGVAHGAAHGTEGPSGAIASYAAGFMLATAALHAAGFAFGHLLSRGIRIAGGATAAAGVALFVVG